MNSNNQRIWRLTTLILTSITTPMQGVVRVEQEHDCRELSRGFAELASKLHHFMQQLEFDETMRCGGVVTDQIRIQNLVVTVAKLIGKHEDAAE